MKQKSGPDKAPAEQVLKNIRRQTRRQYSAEEKIRIVLEGLRGEENISELCRREGIAASMYYGWSKEFLEAGKRRLAGDTARAATSGEVKDLRREATAAYCLPLQVTWVRSFCGVRMSLRRSWHLTFCRPTWLSPLAACCSLCPYYTSTSDIRRRTW